VGSNIANIGLLLAVTSLAWPLTVHQTIIRREIPMMVLASGVALALGLDQWLGGGGDHFFHRSDGIVLLLLFGVFLYYTITDALRQRQQDRFLRDASATALPPVTAGYGKSAGIILASLLILMAGGELTVHGATGLAQSLGISNVVISLTLVAVGTSLPELFTSLIAARKGQTDMAIGNIVGSNIYNLLFIWGLTATLAPAAVPAGGAFDLAAMTLFAAGLLPLAYRQRLVSRLDGGMLLAAYIVYVAMLAFR
ncbi:MAG: hypothetical protein R3336_02825, partial [Phycisphaeraceae bacterium]|nr:hypothetical protein [Phycisphaeraceae bacterium]